MTTSVPATPPVPQPAGANAWRDLAHAPDGAGADGVALEHLIDLQRGRADRRGEAR
ncbi:hypothetical protein [Citreimonas sp.]|uniref:hypothetical protein n=1 Tax=Citreimonas sp. TaxID=3036715 RepID=UPI0035C7A38D